MSSAQTKSNLVHCLIESVVMRLKSLPRYVVGSADDGGGYMYDYQDKTPDGDWIEASDVDDLIAWIQQTAHALAEDRSNDAQRTKNKIRLAVDAACTCGGAGPGDGCPACNVWHLLYPK